MMKNSPTEAFPSTSRPIELICFAFLLAIGLLLVYAPAIRGEFLYDDLSFIQFNPFIRSLQFLPEYFLSTESASETGHEIWRPLRTLSFAIDYRLWGLRPLGFHLTSVGLHWLNTLFVYWLAHLHMSLSFGSARRFLARAAAVLFAIHPVQTESVCWVSSRGDLLFSSCALAAVLCHWYRGRVSREVVWMLSSLACFALALLSKETAVVLPLILMASDRLLDQRSWTDTWRRSFPFWLLAAAFLWGRAHILESVAQREFWGGGVYPTTLVMLKAAATYLRLLVWPVGLRVDYALSIPTSAFDPLVLLALAVLIPTAVAAWCWGRRSQSAAFWMTWSVVWMLPVSNIIPFHGLLQEHFLYLSMAGVTMIAATWWNSFVGSRALRTPRALIGVVIGVVLMVCCGVMTYDRSQDWRDPITLWSATARLTPNSSLAHISLGRHYFDARRYEESIEAYERALSLTPNRPLAQRGLGLAYGAIGNYARAETLLLSALDLDPTVAGIHYNLGVLQLHQGQYQRAMKRFIIALALDPRYAKAHYNLSVLYAAMDPPNTERAAWHAEQAKALGM